MKPRSLHKDNGYLAWNQHVHSCYSYQFCYILSSDILFISFGLALTTSNFISCTSLCLNSILLTKYVSSMREVIFSHLLGYMPNNYCFLRPFFNFNFFKTTFRIRGPTQWNGDKISPQTLEVWLLRLNVGSTEKCCDGTSCFLYLLQCQTLFLIQFKNIWIFILTRIFFLWVSTGLWKWYLTY